MFGLKKKYKVKYMVKSPENGRIDDFTERLTEEEIEELKAKDNVTVMSVEEK